MGVPATDIPTRGPIRGAAAAAAADLGTSQRQIGDHAVIEAGKDLVRHLTVDESRAIDFLGPEIRVYATPAMIEDAEFACRDLLLTMIDPGQDSVGTYVEFFHVGSAPIGSEVALRVALVSSTDRRVVFEVAFTGTKASATAGTNGPSCPLKS